MKALSCQTFGEHTEALRLAVYLSRLIHYRNPKAKEHNLQKWAQCFDRIIRIDGQSAQDIKDMILFAQKHDFWHKNILSPEKLRKHWDRLFLEGTQHVKDNKTYSIDLTL